MKRLLIGIILIVILSLVVFELYLLSSSITLAAEIFQIEGGEFYFSIGAVFLIFVVIFYALKKLR